MCSRKIIKKLYYIRNKCKMGIHGVLFSLSPMCRLISWLGLVYETSLLLLGGRAREIFSNAIFLNLCKNISKRMSTSVISPFYIFINFVHFKFLGSLLFMRKKFQFYMEDLFFLGSSEWARPKVYWRIKRNTIRSWYKQADK